MPLPKVFVTRRIPDQGLEILRKAADVDVWEGELPPPYETLVERSRGVDGLLSLLSDRVDAALMDAIGPQLKVIANYAVGFDNIDIAAATQRRIPVGNTPGVLTETTADFAWALLMAAGRRVAEGDRFTRAGHWKTWGPSILLGRDIYGATLGIIGFGRIGQALARRARGFSMRILYYDAQRFPEAEAELGAQFAELPALLAEADYISLHTALTAETRHLMSAAQFAQMKPTAVLVNTSRGPVVDEAALYQALASGQIASAGLDVTEVEPLPMDSPLLKLENIILAPHIASASVQSRTKMATIAAENIAAGLAGQKLPACANPQVYG
jgi:glyoxylate reductase